MKIKFNEPRRACGLCWDCRQLSLENNMYSTYSCFNINAKRVWTFHKKIERESEREIKFDIEVIVTEDRQETKRFFSLIFRLSPSSEESFTC